MEERRPLRARTIGLALAIGLALLFAGGLGILVLRARMNQRPVAESQIRAPELRDPPEELGSFAGSDVSIFDRDDPTRLNARILSKRTDPIPERRGMVRVEEPQAWVYLADGRAVHIRANGGEFHMPDNQQSPESGTISGDVVVTLYPPAPDGASLDREGQQPDGTLKTQSLTFDGTNLELSTLDRFEIESARVSATGTGIKLILNELKERIEYLEIRKGESITYTPAPRDAAPSGVAPAPGKAPPGPRAAPPPQEGAPAPQTLETFYHVTFSEGVVVAQGERSLKADRVSAWARLIDNQLPPEAFAKIGAPGASVSVAEQPSGARREIDAMPGSVASTVARDPSAGDPAAGDQPALRPSELPIIMTWAGPCVLRPLEAAPAELAHEHLALRGTAEQSGLVTFADPGVGGAGHCATLDYGLTSGRLTLAGIGPASVSLSMGNGGTLEAVRIALDLVALRGEIPSPGMITAPVQREGGRARQASWTEHARFRLGRDPAGKVWLREASFTGKVRASDEESVLRSDYLHAWLGRSPEGKPVLTRVYAEDRQRVEAVSPNADVKCGWLELTLTPGAEGARPDPTLLEAGGTVEAESDGSRVECGTLVANLRRRPDGSVGVTTAQARDGFRFWRDRDGLGAGAADADADAEAQSVSLVGPDSFVEASGARIGGPQIHLDGGSRTVAVFGAWTFEHAEREGAPPVLASGASGLTFDDLSGIAEGSGAVTAVSVRRVDDDEERSTLAAERVRLEFTPAPREERRTAEPPARPATRRLLRATAIGGVLENEGGTLARADSVRSVADGGVAGGRRTVQAIRVEAPRLVADEQAGTLDAPGPGRLLVRDHRPIEGTGRDAQDLRGDTLFTWQRALHLERSTGAMEMTGDSSLTHMSLAHDRVIRMMAERLAATLAAPAASPGQEPGNHELISASARGAVHASIGSRQADAALDREMIADQMEYDAATGIVQATAAAGNLVTLFEGRRGTATSADRMTWNVASDEIRFVRPRPVVIPR